ncbi:MAG: hypothetical protein WC437_00020 [Patescibacteria group bacterium]|jgi:hypothetical protein|nr:hypothetical protein [Patescibacteria group bacterium]
MEETSQETGPSLVQEIPKESTLLEWESLEYIKSETTKYWMIGVIVVFTAIVGFFVYKKDYFGAGFAAVIAVCLYFYKRQSPTMKRYRITQLGVYVDDKIYPYNIIHSFSLNTVSAPQKLKIRLNKRFSPHLNVLLEGVDALTIKTLLEKNVPETPNDDSIVDSIIKFLKIQ